LQLDADSWKAGFPLGRINLSTNVLAYADSYIAFAVAWPAAHLYKQPVATDDSDEDSRIVGQLPSDAPLYPRLLETRH